MSPKKGMFTKPSGGRLELHLCTWGCTCLQGSPSVPWRVSSRPCGKREALGHQSPGSHCTEMEMPSPLAPPQLRRKARWVLRSLAISAYLLITLSWILFLLSSTNVQPAVTFHTSETVPRAASSHMPVILSLCTWEDILRELSGHRAALEPAPAIQRYRDEVDLWQSDLTNNQLWETCKHQCQHASALVNLHPEN
jgi:hypothetical protein